MAEKDRQIEELRGDIDQLKKKLAKLINLFGLLLLFLQHSLDDEKQKVGEILAEKDRQIEELRGDIDQLNKKLAKLIK